MTEPTIPQTPPRKAIGTLTETIGFSPSDLAANRAGTISDAQRKRLQNASRRQIIIGAVAVIGIILVATLMFFLGQQNNSPVLSIIGASLTVINAVIVGRLAQTRMRLNADLRGGVSTTEGVVTHTVKVFNRVATYLIEINGERLLVPRPVFFAFEERARYTLYRTGATKTLLSAEKTA